MITFHDYRKYTFVLFASAVCALFNPFSRKSEFSFNTFEVAFQWSYINFTWDTYERYAEAIQRREYIPENVMPGGIKFYKDFMFVALPKHRRGVPVTLAYLSTENAQQINSLLSPYPNWELNDERDCYNLQSMLSMEIDTKGILWAIDGVRLVNNIQCPPKLVLMDLNNFGRRIHTYIFPNEVCLQNGGFLNDIVVDETSGDFAYITDNSNIDPGIIIYSRYENRAWKIRDSSMFAETYASNFFIQNYLFSQLAPVDGIALSPISSSNRTLYYSSLTGYALYGIDTSVLKNEELCRTNTWRFSVQLIGTKESQTDGMMMDSIGNLYYTLVPLSGVGKWRMVDPFEISEIVYVNRKELIWPDGFGMDQKGNLYVISSRAYSFVDSNYTLQFTPDIKFNIFRLYTGTKSYLYNGLRHFENLLLT